MDQERAGGRRFFSFPSDEPESFKIQMLNWSHRFGIFCFLDSHTFPGIRGEYEALLAAGAKDHVTAPAAVAWKALRSFYGQHNDWLFGHLSYEMGSEGPAKRPVHPDRILFPDLFFFRPEILILLKEGEICIGLCPPATEKDAKLVLQEILAAPTAGKAASFRGPAFESPLSETDYLQAVNALQGHLRRGDAYEVNFCREFFAAPAYIQPLTLFLRLNGLSPAPFAAYYRLEDKYLLCASPERFLRKKGAHVISQPIKGTSRRGNTPEEDEALRQYLYNNAKERAENVMIVDLVRNDLARTAARGSVRVEELFGIYTFAQVHQMISTVGAVLDPEYDAVDAIQAAFPMGSMTGAPKHRVLQLIERYERSRRGLFSGSVGYFTPEGDFDFNVVIRSLLYNATSRYLSFQTGSAITFYSDPRRELEECLLKAAALQKVCSGG